MGVKELSLRAISDAVINIRSSKLPDPKEVGNAGSFFKKPYVGNEKYDQLKSEFPTIAAAEMRMVQLTGSWLADRTMRMERLSPGDAGVHPKHTCPCHQ
jgi:UDP-N-acetylmuramate dehydrogenase